MIPIIALSLAVLAPEPSVTGLSVVPVADRTEVVIEVDGEVMATHFPLTDPARLVVDLRGVSPVEAARHSVGRGGVQSVRIGPFQPGIIRVVIDLDADVEYRFSEEAGALRLSFPNNGGAFTTWTVASGLTTAEAERQPEAAPAAAAPPPEAFGAAPDLQEVPITVEFTERPLSEVLSAFADFAGTSIIASETVKSKSITADIRNQPWDRALSAILAANGLYARELESGVIIVLDAASRAETQTQEPLEVRQIQLQFVSADSIVNSVRQLITEQGRAAANPAANSLLITERPSVLDQVMPLIREMDVRPPQVNISAKIAFVDRTALEQMGVTYDLKDSRGNQFNQKVSGFADQNGNGVFEPDEATSEDVVLLGGNSVAALANANYPVPSPALELVTSLVLGRHTLITFLEALQTVTLSDIQATPTITVMNHRPAYIQVGQETPVRVIDAGAFGAGGGGGGAGAQAGPVATVEFKQTGVILAVTPHIIGDQVRLVMHAERSDAIPASSDIGVVFTTQEADTEVLVSDGETAVIGGLTITEKSKVRTGIPFLMDLPVIGSLFRNTREQENKRDLLIMVTPHIIRD